MCYQFVCSHVSCAAEVVINDFNLLPVLMSSYFLTWLFNLDLKLLLPCSIWQSVSLNILSPFAIIISRANGGTTQRVSGTLSSPAPLINTNTSSVNKQMEMFRCQAAGGGGTELFIWRSSELTLHHARAELLIATVTRANADPHALHLHANGGLHMFFWCGAVRLKLLI